MRGLIWGTITAGVIGLGIIFGIALTVISAIAVGPLSIFIIGGWIWGLWKVLHWLTHPSQVEISRSGNPEPYKGFQIPQRTSLD